MRDRIMFVPLVSVLALAAFVPASTMGAEPPQLLLKFRGGIGVDPISNVTLTNGTPTPSANTVRGVPPGGQLWVIRRLDAEVGIDGHIHVHGRGLLLAGGNAIGTAPALNVFATLFCGPAASATASSSNATGVALESNGDFTIDDVLSPTPPDPCDSPVLLIRNTGGSQAWFAAGIVQLLPTPQ